MRSGSELSKGRVGVRVMGRVGVRVMGRASQYVRVWGHMCFGYRDHRAMQGHAPFVFRVKPCIVVFATVFGPVFGPVF